MLSNEIIENKTELVIYESQDGNIKLDVNLENEKETTAKHGAIDGKTQTYLIDYYNLDEVIGVGYLVKSLESVRFRKWATARIKQYIIKGYAMDDEHLKNLGGGKYFCELLNRIKDIRSSEKEYLNSINKINKIAEKLNKD